MTDISSIISMVSGGATGLLTSTQIVQNLQEIFSGRKPDLVAAEKLLLSLYKELNQAERNQMSLERALAGLEKELKAADRFAHEAARYELTQTDMGGRVYALKKDDPSGEPPHEICADCFERSEKRILQPSTEKRNTLVCNTCGSKVFKDDGRGSGIMVTTTRSSRGLW
ncbi:hypothetical protein [Aliiroseovarius lamellibrachiae]|uniref:hypothetical protein n=1 Tax=Aliiroseovarius lamellibrachiae TaxID=1924933 RepID=UPI001BE06A08|nr:hypothetical protein [Aliiroseovarius lamellibrachiae]MBT2131196.1 hypothetical protein [Aliiroseovarius lamellibrachiae]